MKKILVLAAVVAAIMVTEVTFGQSTYTWNSSARQVWVRNDNWTGGATGKAPGVGANTATTVYGTSTDIALFGAISPNGSTSLINFGTSSNTGNGSNSAANGALALGAIGLTDAATSSLTIQNSSTSAGVLTLNGATLNSISNTIIRNASASNLTFSNGSSSMGIALGNATENIIQIGGSGNVSIGANLSGLGRSLSLQATGTGNLTLSGTNTYTGGTSVNSGVLIVSTAGSLAAQSFSVASGATLTSQTSALNATGTNTINGTVNADGGFNLASGATLGGTGTINGATAISGALAPGNSIGTLNVIGNVTWNSGSNWKFELGAGNTSDLLNITGDLLKGTGTSFTFDFGGSTELGTFKLVDWTGTTNFSLSNFSFTGLGGGNTGSFSFSGTQLNFTAVPEPSALLLVGSIIGAGLLRRRRA